MKKLLSVFIALFIGSVMVAQTIITGTVKEKDGQPIPGANIQIVGKSIGTTTDFDGNYPRYAWRCSDDAHFRGYSPDRPVCARYRSRRQSSRR